MLEQISDFCEALTCRHHLIRQMSIKMAFLPRAVINYLHRGLRRRRVLCERAVALKRGFINILKQRQNEKFKPLASNTSK